MDILISSNLERMLYYATKGNTALIAEWMSDLKTKGVFKVEGDVLADIQALFKCGWANDDATREMVHEAWHKDHRLIDPHTAVALKVARERDDQSVPCVVLSTASPYKFCRDVYLAVKGETLSGDADGFAYMDALQALTGEVPPKPLAELRSLPVRHKTVVTPDGMADVIRSAAAKPF